MTPEQRASKVAETMLANDVAAAQLGLVCKSIGVGTATCSMVVKDKDLNGHAICHGGVIYTLADTAFALACNSYNQSALAQNNSITYIAPGQLGDVLLASAVEISKSGRSGIYDVVVENQHGTAIAHFRGHSRTIKGQVFKEESVC